MYVCVSVVVGMHLINTCISAITTTFLTLYLFPLEREGLLHNKSKSLNCERFSIIIYIYIYIYIYLCIYIYVSIYVSYNIYIYIYIYL